jgi:hypothetical protein
MGKWLASSKRRWHDGGAKKVGVALQSVAEHAQHNNLDTTRKRYMPTVCPALLVVPPFYGPQAFEQPVATFRSVKRGLHNKYCNGSTTAVLSRGAPWSMKTGTIVSLWHNDAVTD